MADVYRIVGGEPGYETSCSHLGMLVYKDPKCRWKYHTIKKLTDTEIIVLKLAGQFVVGI